MQEELGSRGFAVITVALDKSAEAARPWIEASKPSSPAAMHVALNTEQNFSHFGRLELDLPRDPHLPFF